MRSHRVSIELLYQGGIGRRGRPYCMAVVLLYSRAC
eukprot:COSAG01_NODE_57443_length_312_cov_0.788732_1_plen_35_part_10